MIPPIARRFVAGETEAEALERARRLNERGLAAMVNRLGSHNGTRDRAAADAAAYRRLVEDAADAGLDAAVTVKPTQIGLDVGEDVFRELLWSIVERADERGGFVWLDMEEHTTTDATLDAFEEAATRVPGTVGVCVQANLKRTPGDVERLVDVPGAVRFVKGGAYDEPTDVAHADDERIDRAYRELLRYAFEQFDGGVVVATHDPEMIAHATSLHERYGTDFEFQMLMGVHPDAQLALADEYEVRQYVPYGPRWKQWALNRARNNLRFAARAVFEGAIGGRSPVREET